jgi:hypothetical protein
MANPPKKPLFSDKPSGKRKWSRLSIIDVFQHAARFDMCAVPSNEIERISKFKEFEDLSFPYRWLHKLTEFAARYEKLKPFAIEPDIDAWIEGVRWLDFIDSVKNRKIVWWFACGIKQVEITKQLNMDKKTVADHYNVALDQVARALNNSFFPTTKLKIPEFGELDAIDEDYHSRKK